MKGIRRPLEVAHHVRPLVVRLARREGEDRHSSRDWQEAVDRSLAVGHTPAADHTGRVVRHTGQAEGPLVEGSLPVGVEDMAIHREGHVEVGSHAVVVRRTVPVEEDMANHRVGQVEVGNHPAAARNIDVP